MSSAARLALLALVALPAACGAGRAPAERAATDAGERPASVALVGPDEPGRTLVLTGRVFDEDGATPLAGARLDLYQTDAGGMYTRPVSVAREARIRGSVWTDAQGRYEVRTIQPGKYPSGGQPAHLHVHLAAPGVPEHWIPSFLFAGDPDLSEEQLAEDAELGRFSPIVAPREDPQGVLRGVRDIRLDRAWARRNHLVDGWYQGE